MKNKSIVFISISIILVITILLGIIYGKSKKEITSDNPEFVKYVSAYTSGLISKKSTIKIKFTENALKDVDKDKIDLNSLFDFSPDIEGEANWIDDYTVEFIPANSMPSDAEFYVEVNLDNIFPEIPEDLKIFSFVFKTLKQSFSVSVDEQITIDKKELKWQRINGTLQTADYEELERVKKTIKASQNGDELKIKWLESKENKVFSFYIDSIARSDNESFVILDWNGEAIDSDIKREEKIEIPSVKDFKYMSYKIIHQPDQYVQLQFSDPLQSNQYLNGLLYFDEDIDVNFVCEDNIIRIYPSERLDGEYVLNISKNIKNILGYNLKEDLRLSLFFEKIKPEVRFVSEGYILPSNDHGLIVPFEAVNIKAVDVRIQKIYENNIMQFLQVNDFQGDYQLYRVGKTVLQKTIPLDKDGVTDLGQWNRFYLDVNELINAEPGAVYRITINFRKKHSLYACDNSDDKAENSEELENINSSWDNSEEYEEQSFWDYFDDYYYGDYDWENRDNPCYDAYYGARRAVSKNIIATNLGLIAKKSNDGNLKVVVNDIITTIALSGITVEVYDFQQQLLGSVKTNELGVADFENIEEPYFIIAKNGKERAYLRLNDGETLSLSLFDVSGVSVKDGIKGFIYGERGVWRPGDSLYVTFILEDKKNLLPQNSPVVFELRNPDYQLVERKVQKINDLGFYTFRLKTDENAPTGSWEAKVKIGNVEFTRYLRIETIKPNRLKINLDFGKKYLSVNQPAVALMNVKWLHGAIAKGLDAKVEVIFSPTTTNFKKYKDYKFDDVTKSFYSDATVIFDGKLDDNGNANISFEPGDLDNAPGKLNVTFITKVFEKGGDFSIDKFTLPYYAYPSFTGIKLPKGDKVRGMLLTDTTHVVEIITVDEKGKIINDPQEIEMSIYKIDWRFWWDQSYENLSSYIADNYYEPISKSNIVTKNGKAAWKFRINYPDWGRYVVIARNLTTVHSASQIVYIDWPGWAGRQQKDNPGGAAMLMFTADKDKYNIDDMVTLTIPSPEKGRAFISIENGSGVIQTHWLETEAGETKFNFKVTEKMAPNIYVYTTLLQPHAQSLNDMPIRLYGVLPLTIENPSTHLEPLIDMPDELKSEEKAKITISEKNGKEMTYTIAIVDEGLLDLTRFSTPDPWHHFYAKEALGVKTWDVYDYVIGAFGTELEKILAVGGGAEGSIDVGNKKAQRFKPMVKFLGPFHLKGGSKTHVIKIPKYIGSVRTMVVAGHGSAYGSAEKTTPVTKPLMVLGTMPRVLGPGETLKLPVSVFAMDKTIKQVNIMVKTNDLIKINGESKKYVNFKEMGEEFVTFDLEVLEKTGIAKVEIIAYSGNEKASYDIEIDVRNPNPEVTDIMSAFIDKNKSWSENVIPVGIEGSNSAVLEVSSIPPLNLEKRLKYLIQYPHGCIEQTTSSAFPQLYLESLLDLSDKQKEDISRNIKHAIIRIKTFQMYNGGFSYWPGGNYTSDWGTSYAGHFLIEAKNKGYNVSSSLLNKWKQYQKNKANHWIDDGYSSQLMQAYRLYTLALAGSPEIGAMNRLNQTAKLSPAAKWRLALAYQILGKQKTALKIIEGLTTEIADYQELAYTFGSSLRDKTMILETLTALDKKETAFILMKEISEYMSKDTWYSTQTTAYSLLAISKFMDKNMISKEVSYTYSFGSVKNKTVKTNKPVSQVKLDITNVATPITVQNNGEGMIYVRVIKSGIPAAGNETDAANNLQLTVNYYDMNGQIINPEKIEQGTDFYAEVKIKHPGMRDNYYQMALTQIFPSGWEIINTRLLDIGDYMAASVPTYQDIRDDRVYTYFDIYRYKTNTYRVLLNASYEGRYYLPAISCEAMYDATIFARKKGAWVEVVKAGSN
ncbi:MAG: MG2 domain-containing protein [Marinilabiliales bacterium]